MSTICSQVIYVAGIRHLLHVNPERPVVARVKLDDAMFNHVLQVGKASPDVPLVLHGICSWARVPVPEAGHWLTQCIAQKSTDITVEIKLQVKGWIKPNKAHVRCFYIRR